MGAFVKSSYFAIAAVTGVLMAAGHAKADDKKYVVGVSNTLIGNGWREEMVCSIKAEALASGKVSKVILANRNGGPSEQIADIRNLISAGANIIIINPSDRKALDPVIKQATDRGIVVVTVDQAVDAPTAHVVTNDQKAYGKLGAEALFKKLGGKGNVVELRGIDWGARRRGSPRGLYGSIEELSRTSRLSPPCLLAGLPDKAAQQMKELLASGKQIDGVWTSGTDKNVIDAYKAANLKYVPVVGADNNGFMGQEIEMKDAGVVGINVTNPPAVGGAGLSVALDILAGKSHPQSDPSCAGSLRQLDSGGAGVAQGSLRPESGPELSRPTAR